MSLRFPHIFAAFALLTAACGPTVIVDGKAGTGLRIGSLTFSPDEKQLAYATADWTQKKGDEDEAEDSEETTKTGNFQMAALPPSGKPASVNVEACAAGNAYRMRWAHEAKKLAVAARDSLAVLEPKGKKKGKFTATPLIESQKDCADKNPVNDILSLVWSPDDSTIAFSDGNDIFTIPSEGGDVVKIAFAAPLPGGEKDRLTLLEWSTSGWIVKRGPVILSIDPESKEPVTRHELRETDDWVTTSGKGGIFVVTSDGKVQEVRATGPKTVLTLKAQLTPKAKSKAKSKSGKAKHQYVIELSPSGKLLAVAESLAEKGRTGSALTLVKMPGAKGKAKEPAKKTKKKKAEESEESTGADEEGKGDEAAAEAGEGEEKPAKAKKAKKAAEGEGDGEAEAEAEKPAEEPAAETKGDDEDPKKE